MEYMTNVADVVPGLTDANFTPNLPLDGIDIKSGDIMVFMLRARTFRGVIRRLTSGSYLSAFITSKTPLSC